MGASACSSISAVRFLLPSFTKTNSVSGVGSSMKRSKRRNGSGKNYCSLSNRTPSDSKASHLIFTVLAPF